MERSVAPLVGMLMLASAAIVVGAGTGLGGSVELTVAVGTLVAAGLAFLLVGTGIGGRVAGVQFDREAFDGFGRVAIGVGLLSVASTVTASPRSFADAGGSGVAVESANALGVASPTSAASVPLLYAAGFGVAGVCGVAMGVGVFARRALRR